MQTTKVDLKVMCNVKTFKIKYDNKEFKDGYEFVDYLHNKLLKSRNHKLPLKDALAFVKFYGLKQTMNYINRCGIGVFGVVAQAAIERLDFAFSTENYNLYRGDK